MQEERERERERVSGKRSKTAAHVQCSTAILREK
jgi:hypothetical protein